MLADVVEHLSCPVCAGRLKLDAGALLCTAGHRFDVARQGYANLLSGNARPGTADTPEMVRARDAFLSAGHFGVLTERLAERAARTDALVLDAGAGTGHYLKAILDRSPGTAGLALDISKHAARRAARAHPRAGAVVADLWRPLPVRDAAADTVVNVFAPRNAPEFHRVLKPGGILYTVTPSERHLGTLVRALGLLSVDERKAERMDTALAGHFTAETREDLETEALLSHDDAATLVAMGPSAHHVAPEELRRRLADLPDPFPVPLSFVLSAYRRLG
ncbi:putative RNA methyltransferase [Actinomadura sp. 21ATH]|uniref:putative RNA methyltransferase n=1 Tax=Actinomadura sp. 21ATH TaxID=1735444 RepID=UPI0035BEEFEC